MVMLAKVMSYLLNTMMSEDDNTAELRFTNCLQRRLKIVNIAAEEKPV